LSRRRGGWPSTVSAIAGGIGGLLAVSDGGMDSRRSPTAFTGSGFGGGVPGPGGGLGLACAG